MKRKVEVVKVFCDQCIKETDPSYEDYVKLNVKEGALNHTLDFCSIPCRDKWSDEH